jgi:hypothetical protein
VDLIDVKVADNFSGIFLAALNSELNLIRAAIVGNRGVGAPLLGGDGIGSWCTSLPCPEIAISVADSSISDNDTGISLQPDSSLTLTNAAISGNGFGGIRDASQVMLTNSTVSGNHSPCGCTNELPPVCHPGSGAGIFGVRIAPVDLMGLALE